MVASSSIWRLSMEGWKEKSKSSRVFLMEKYVDIPELTTTIVNEFIKQIIVYAPDKSSGKRTQKVKIVFNFLKEVEVPEISEPVESPEKFV